MRSSLTRLALVGALLTALSPIAPAMATGLDGEKRSPELAAGLAVGAPIGLMALSRFSPDPLVSVAVPALGLGVGHVYAGNPVRGAVVALGSAVAGAGVVNLLRPTSGSGGGTLQVVVLLGAVVALGLAAQDAYVTTHMANAAQSRIDNEPQGLVTSD